VVAGQLQLLLDLELPIQLVQQYNRRLMQSKPKLINLPKTIPATLLEKNKAYHRLVLKKNSNVKKNLTHCRLKEAHLKISKLMPSQQPQQP